MATQLTAAQRIAQVSHVQYELTQMVGAALRVDTVKDQVVNNALLESALLHVRSLIDFVTDGGRSTDVRASTFPSTWTLTDAERTALAARKDALDKHLAHITKARTTDGQQQWPYVDIVRDVVEHMRRYHAGLPAGSPAETAIGDTLRQIDREAPRVAVPTRATSTLVQSTTTTSTAIAMTRSTFVDRLRLRCFN